MRLLSKAESNKKLSKSKGKGYLVAGMSLRPAELSGYNVCPWAGACKAVCVLEHAGHGPMGPVQEARSRRTIQLFEDRKGFLADLRSDLDELNRKAMRENMIPLVRLNVASDVSWETIDKGLFTAFPGMEFYDYTKGIKRLGKTPKNYHLTYSWSEKSNGPAVAKALLQGYNIAVVFDTMYNPVYHDIRALPKVWTIPGTNYKFPVVDGDNDDLRLPEFDGTGVIVGLRGKGGQRKVLNGVNTGFIMPTVGGRLALAAKA